MRLSKRYWRVTELLLTRGCALATKFALTIYLARVVGLDVLGWYGLIVSASLAGPILLRGGVFNALLREFALLDAASTRKELSLYRSFVALGYCVLTIPIICAAFFAGVTPVITLCVVWIIYCEQRIADATQILFALRKPRAAAWLTLGYTIGSAALFMIISTLEPSWRSLDGLLLSWSAAATLTVAVLNWSAAERLQPPSVKQTIGWARRLLIESRAIYLHELLNTARDHSDRYLITLLMGIEATGVYVFFLQFANGASTLVNSAFVFPARSSLIAAAHESVQAFTIAFNALCLKALALMAMLLGLAILAFVAVGQFALPQAVAAQFAVACWVLAASWLQMALTLAGMGLYARRRDGVRLMASCCAAATIPLAALMLVPTHGLIGMAWANMLASILALAIVLNRRCVASSR